MRARLTADEALLLMLLLVLSLLVSLASSMECWPRLCRVSKEVRSADSKLGQIAAGLWGKVLCRSSWLKQQMCCLACCGCC